MALTRTGMVLGVEKEEKWTQASAQLAPGDVLVLYTDGITDAEDERGEFFGQERLLETVLASLGSSAQDIQDSLLTAVQNFVGNSVQFDDIALMVVRRDV